MTKHIEQARRALAGVDVIKHAQAIALAQKQQAELADAIEAGRERLGEIAREIADARANISVDPNAAADAMLAGQALPVVDIEGLRAQQEAVKVGMDTLRGRERALGDVVRQERSEGVAALAEAAEPLTAAIGEMVCEAATMLASAFAAAESVRRATASGNASYLADKIASVVHQLQRDGYLEAASIPVPPNILDALRVAEDQIAAMRHSIPTEILTFARPASAPIADEPRREPGPSKAPDRVSWLS